MREIYSVKRKQTSINVSGSRIESVRGKDILKTGLRIIEGGCIGVAGAIGGYNPEELENRARKALSAMVEYPYELSSNREEEIDLIKDIFPNDNLINEVEAALEYLRTNHRDFIFSNKVNLDTVNITLANENNLKLAYKDSAVDFSLVFKEKASSNIMDGFIVFQDRKYDKKDFIIMADSILNAYRNTVDFTEGNYPVVFLDLDDTPLIKFMTDLNGRDFGTGSSLFSGKLGQKIFSENFTLFNSMNPADTCLTPFFDAEGVVNESYSFPLIENGVLRAANTDKKFSTLYNLPHTGSAVSDYDSTPQPGFARLKVKDCEKTAKELLAGDKGIVVLVASGGDFTPDGNFASPVQLAYLFDGEKLTGRLPEIQVSSNVFDMYGNCFRGVSKNEIWPLGGIKAMVMDMKVSKI
ncbi:MAG: putative Zn-dependent protease-like protein [Eubacterium sp.]|jgi:PmbA protein|nr:putative Zn-dependent protease-like protein [Eubacterium sp.]